MSRRAAPLPQVNPTPNQCRTCDPRHLVVYLATKLTDRITRPSLALLIQDLACRQFARHHLHLGIEAEFADGLVRAAHLPMLQPPTERLVTRSGFARLLAHIALCHNRRVVVARLDRLPSTAEASRLHRIGARVLSATEPNNHKAVSQADMADCIQRDLAIHYPTKPCQRKEAQ